MNTSSNQKPLAAISEVRRPGITKLAEKIALEHPSWSDDRVHRQAKVQWHEQNKQR